MKRFCVLIVLVFLAARPLLAAPSEQRLTILQGRLGVHDLNSALCRNLRLPVPPGGGEIEVNTPAGADFVFAVNACLWNGCSLTVSDPTTAVLRFDEDEAPGKCEALRRITRVYAAEHAPHATAAQARNWGLLMPGRFDASKPLVVLIHGLDSDRSDCKPIGDLLQQAGHQVAYFSYPGDQPIVDSAALLARYVNAARAKYPELRINIVAHSMGGLVARQFIEGPDYTGGVTRLIMVAPPNGGSKWARFRSLLSVAENYHLRRYEPDWNWTWLLTEGMGQAGCDLLPGSDFLNQLNALPRRPGVRYTIVAGNKSDVHRFEGNCMAGVSNWIPTRARTWWGLRNCYNGLHTTADRLQTQTGDSDGPVSLDSAKLAGVCDYVVLPANHVSLYLSVDGNPPAAWPVVRDRVAN